MRQPGSTGDLRHTALVIDVDLARLDDDEQYDQAIRLLVEVTDRLLDDVRDLDDEDVRAPSLLPGWTRGHVLTHVARNADALCRLLHWARTGEETRMYPSREARDAEIEDGAQRSASDLEADVEASGERLLAGLADLPPDRRGAWVRASSGSEFAVREILWMRVREVAYHHVDLAIGLRFADLPPAVIARGLPEAIDRTAVDPAAQGVRGEDGDLLGWLTGREGSQRLAADGQLPVPAPWG